MPVREETELGPLGVPVQWKALLEALQTQGFRYIPGDYLSLPKILYVLISLTILAVDG